MARLSVIFAVIFSLLVLSQARINLPENDVVVGATLPDSDVVLGNELPKALQESNDVVGNELPKTLPESDVALPDSDVSSPVLRLPSDNVNGNADQESQTKESDSVTGSSVPLSFVRLHPINRHLFHRSRSLSRPCHHHHRHYDGMFKPMMRSSQEIPYGDDMILSGGENGDFDPIMFHRGMRRIPARWVRFHHHHHRHHEDENENSNESANNGASKLEDETGIPSRFMFKHSDRFGREKFKKHLRHEDDHQEENANAVTKSEDGGFMKRIRKMLNHF